MTSYSSPKPLRWWQKHRNRVLLVGLLFVLPALVNFTVFRYIPIIGSAWYSFWDYSLLGGFREFVGLDNYVRALTRDSSVLNGFRVTLLFVVLKVPLQVTLALFLAVFASQERRGTGVIRALIFIPVVTSFIVVSIVWGMLLIRDIGLLNSLLQTLGLPRQSFLTSPTNALPSIVAIALWKDVGYSVIILVAGLKGIPVMLYEAATIDGANARQRFLFITIPMLRRALTFVIITTTLFSFQMFIPVYALTGGGPGQATNVIVHYVYQQAFVYSDMGYASALSIILLMILFVVSAIQLRVLRGGDS